MENYQMNSDISKIGPSFAQFLTTGNLGVLSLQTMLQEAYELLGAPEGIDEYEDFAYGFGRDIDTLTNLYYSGLYLSFHGQELVQLNVEFDELLSDVDLPAALQVDWYPSVMGKPLSLVISYLKQYNVNAKYMDLQHWVEAGEHVVLIEESNIAILAAGQDGFIVEKSNAVIFAAAQDDLIVYKISWHIEPVKYQYKNFTYQLRSI